MSKDKIIRMFKKTPLILISFIVLLAISFTFLIHMEKNNVQSVSPVPPAVEFVGEYKIGDGDWQEYNGKHIPNNKGKDVTLNGYFMIVDSNNGEKYPVSKGLSVAFYLNHINVSIENKDGSKFQLFCEVKAAGESSCGETWQFCPIQTEAYEPMTIVISNPHIYGNANAVDDMLNMLSLYYNTNFELMILRESRFERLFGFFVMFCGIIVLVVGLFSYLLNIKRIESLPSIGLMVFFAGGYLFFCSSSISLYFDSISGNTIVAFLAAMFYYFFLMKAGSDILVKEKKIFGKLSILVAGLILPISILVTVLTDLYFFDLWFVWAIFQGVSFILLFIGVGFNVKNYNLARKIVLVVAFIAFITYALDTLFCGIGGFEESRFSQLSFILIFIIVFVSVLALVPKHVNSTIKNKQLEEDKIVLNGKLQESRILLMISQIQPHFLYNMLNTIYHLCDKDV